MGKYFEILKQRYSKRKHYIDNLDNYLRDIKIFFQEELPNSEVVLFGSALSENFNTNSDVDVLIVSDDTFNKSKLLINLYAKIGRITPFEFHFATREQYENWYKNFIKNNKKEILI